MCGRVCVDLVEEQFQGAGDVGLRSPAIRLPGPAGPHGGRGSHRGMCLTGPTCKALDRCQHLAPKPTSVVTRLASLGVYVRAQGKRSDVRTDHWHTACVTTRLYRFMTTRSIMEVRGYNGQVEFDGNSLTITRKGLGRITVGKGQIRIPISSVTAVRWKPAGPLVNGYIHFTMMGSNDRRSTFSNQTKNVGHDENSVIFLRSQMPDFEKLRTAVEASITQNAQPQARPHA